MIRVLNLGAGVQSTTVLLMSCKGILPKLDCAIFADTGWEPDEVYEHLDRLKGFSSIPIVIVGNPTLRQDEVSGKTRTFLPAFVKGKSEAGGRKLRKCTSEYKIVPIERWIIRELLGIRRNGRRPKQPVVEQWYGISIDEVQRMRSAPDIWREFVYPLCGMPKEMLPAPYSRRDCMQWLKENWPYPVPRSACLGCPFHSNAEWRRIKENPKYWADVVEFDKAIRHSGGIRGEVFLHRSLKPLDQVDFSTPEDKGQLNLFNNECQGMCGV